MVSPGKEAKNTKALRKEHTYSSLENKKDLWGEIFRDQLQSSLCYFLQ